MFCTDFLVTKEKKGLVLPYLYANLFILICTYLQGCSNVTFVYWRLNHPTEQTIEIYSLTCNHYKTPSLDSPLLHGILV